MKTCLTLLILAALSGTLLAQTPAPTLIPFQARLTDQAGVAYNSGQYSIVFQIYDQAVGGSLLWSERHEKVGVINGMVNVFLGSINANLATNDFSRTRYLGITVDGDNNPNTPDPEMVPRQIIIPAFWAKKADSANDSAKLAGFDWTPLFGANNPNGTISGSKLQAGSITGNQIANGQITGTHIIDGSVPRSKLSVSAVNTNAGVGEVAVSLSTGVWVSPTPIAFTEVTNLSVNLTTRGGLVELSLVGTATADPDTSSLINAKNNTYDILAVVTFWRDNVLIASLAQQDFGSGSTASGSRLTMSPTIFRAIDRPPPGTYRYYVKARSGAGTDMQVQELKFYHIGLVAKEH